MFGNRQAYKLGIVVLGILGLMAVFSEVMFWAVRFWLVLVPLAIVFLILIWHGMQPERPPESQSWMDRMESAALKLVMTVVLFIAAATALTFGGYFLILRTGLWLVSAPVLIGFLALFWLALRPRRS